MIRPTVALVDSPEGQVRVEAGVGRLRTVQPAAEGSPFVEVGIDAPPLADPVTGWCDTRVEPFATLFAEGRGVFATTHHQAALEYRVEVHRKAGVDPSLPLEDLEPGLKRRRLVWLAVHHAAPVTVAPQLVDGFVPPVLDLFPGLTRISIRDDEMVMVRRADVLQVCDEVHAPSMSDELLDVCRRLRAAAGLVEEVSA